MATLKTLVDETTNIKNELATCYANLKTNLVEKGLNISNTDKIQDLIEKINALEGITNVVSGDDIILIEKTPHTVITSSSYVLAETIPIVTLKGTIKLSVSVTPWSYQINQTYNVKFEYRRDNIVIDTFEKNYSSNDRTINIIKEFDVLPHSEIRLYFNRGNMTSLKLDSFKVSYNKV